MAKGLRSPVGRAMLPILGGIAFFAALFGITWLAASSMTKSVEKAPSSGNRTFVVGSVSEIAKSVAADGPVLYPDLRDSSGTRSIVIDHTGDDPARGWQVYYAYPADKDAACPITQVEKSRTFSDCDGRTITVEQLKLPTDVRPIVENKTTLLIDLQASTSAP